MLKAIVDCEGCKKRRAKMAKYASIAKARTQALLDKSRKKVSGGGNDDS